MVIRPNAHSERVFPLPAEIAAGRPSPWFAAAVSPLRWFSGPSLPGLLWLHRAALCSEMDGRWLRADFYWREFDAHFARLGKRSGGLGAAVVALAQKIAVPVPEKAEQAAGRFVDELLIDTSVALYNSFSNATEAAATARGACHLERIKARLPDSGMTARERAALLSPLIRAAARSAETAGRWADAAAQYRELLDADLDDRDAQDGIVRALWEQVASVLGTDKSETAAQREAAALAPLIGAMDTLTDRLPYHADLYDALAQAQLLHAVRLANSGQLSEALAAIEKALAARPEWDEAEAVRRQLKEMMEQLQLHSRELDAQLRSSPNTTLNPAGVRLQTQARSGFGPAQRFAASDRAKQWSTFSSRARARRFWLRLGLTEPEGDWNAQAQMLMNVLGYVLTQEPKTPEAIAEQWDAAIAAEPELAALDRGKVLHFLEHRILDKPWQPAEPARREEENAGGDPLTVPPASQVRRPGGAPPGDWWHSGQDRGLKTRLVLAVAAVVAAGGFIAREQSLAGRRDRAFDAVAAAARQQDDTGAMQAAAEFLSTRPFAEDSREPEVVSAYQRAFVHWIAGLPGELRPEHQTIVDRYRQLVLNSNTL